MRGMEEREFLFGKLFGYLSLIRSGKLNSDRNFVSDVLNAFLSLYQAKPWIQEVAIESLLTLFINIVDDDQLSQHIEKYISILPTFPYSLQDLSPNELLVIAALQWFMDYYLSSTSKSSLHTITYPTSLPDEKVISCDSFINLSHIFITACGGYPKVS